MVGSPTISRDHRRGGLWAAFVLLLALQVCLLYVVKGPDTPAPPYADKLLHVTMFALPAVVALLLSRVWPWAVLVLHALLSEPLQAWVATGRQLDAWDTVADLTGIALGALLAQPWSRRDSTRAERTRDRSRP